MMRPNPKTKLPISAIVVGLNEANLLKACFASVDFCNEIIYLDLGSTDASVEIANGAGVTVHKVTRYPAVEAVVAENIALIQNRWVLLIDPDERISNELAVDLGKLSLPELEEGRVSTVAVPWQFTLSPRNLEGLPGEGKTVNP